MFLPNVSGPQFLFFYLIAGLGIIIWMIVVRELSASSEDNAAPTTLQPLTAWEAAIYSDDRVTVTATVAAELINAGIVDDKGILQPVAPKAQLSQPAHLMMRQAQANNGLLPDAIRFTKDKTVAALVKTTVDNLRERGYYIQRPPSRVMIAPKIAMWALFALAVVRGISGLINDRPIDFLVVLSLIVFILHRMLSKTPWFRSQAGSHVVQELISTHDSERDRSVVTPLAVALFGGAAMITASPGVVSWLQTLSSTGHSFGLDSILTSNGSQPVSSSSTLGGGSAPIFGGDSGYSSSQSGGGGCSGGDGCGGGCGGCGG